MHPDPIALAGVTQVDGRLVAHRWLVDVEIDASVPGPVDEPGTAAALRSLRPLGLGSDDVDAVIAEAEVSGVARSTEPRRERVRLGRDHLGRWEVTVSNANGAGADPAPTMTFLTADPAEVADQTLNAVTRRQLHRPAPARLHGGAVTDAAGSAAVVLGPSGAGKSTTTAHLVAAGLHLVNDEQVTLYPDHGLVAAFTRPLVCKPGGTAHLPDPLPAELGPAWRTVLVPASRLGSRHRLVGRPVVVAIVERDGTAPPATEHLDRVDAALALMENNLDLLAHPVEALDAFGWLVTTTPVVRVRARSTAEVARTVAELLADPPDPPGGQWWVRPGSSARGGTGLPAPHGFLHLSSSAVGLGFDDGAVLLDSESGAALTCNGPAAALWAALPSGWPDTGEVRAFVSELRSAGLLEAPDG